jgi:hypothetical protein
VYHIRWTPSPVHQRCKTQDLDENTTMAPDR